MLLVLERKLFTDKCTVGRLTIQGKLPVWYVLEDRNRDLDFNGILEGPNEQKVWGETCIPRGDYAIKIQHSPHFGKDMPYLQNVTGFSGVMIHPGNFIQDTNGCLLVGMGYAEIGENLYQVTESQKAFTQLFPILLSDKDNLYITIQDIPGDL